MRRSGIPAIAAMLALLPLAATAATLNDVMTRALEGDVRVPASIAISKGDDARAALERSSLLPQLSASAAVAQNDQKISSEFFGSSDETYQDTSLALELRQAVFRWDMRSRWKRADLLHALARADEIDRRQIFLNRVVDRYSAVLEAQAALDFALSEQAALREEKDTIEDRARVGLATMTARRETEARAAVAEANLLLAEDDLLSAQHALAELLNGPVPTLLPLPARIPRMDAPVPTEAEFIALARDVAYPVQEASLRLAIAESQITSAVAEAAPQLDLVGRLSEDDASESRIGQLREASRIALELRIPLYAGGAALKALSAARADRDAVTAELELYRRQAAQEARDAWRSVETGYRRLEALDTALDAAQLALDATRDGFEIGSRTQLDVLEARSAVLRAERDQVLARYALLRALARREAAVADLQFDDFPRFDSLFAAAPAQPQASE